MIMFFEEVFDPVVDVPPIKAIMVITETLLSHTLKKVLDA